MEENFNLAAQSRANYYTPGSPVQFVRVELLKGDQSGDNAVCLTYKNISNQPITRLDVRFKCKAANGEILCEETFIYEDLNAGQGELFGMDDAVFITSSAIGSVDVHLEWVYSGKLRMDLREKKRTRLEPAKKLPAELSAKLEQKVGREGMKYVPQMVEHGWYCACGAFHPNEENTVYCSECGGDRVLLQSALSGLMQPEKTQPIPQQADEQTRVMQKGEEPTRVLSKSEAAPAAPQQEEQSETRAFAPVGGEEEVEKTKPVSAAEHFVNNYRADMEEREDAEEDEYDEYEELDPRDERAEMIIRWVPALTVLICAGIALGGFLYCSLFL